MHLPDAAGLLLRVRVLEEGVVHVGVELVPGGAVLLPCSSNGWRHVWRG